jgi:hypothetical protein
MVLEYSPKLNSMAWVRKRTIPTDQVAKIWMWILKQDFIPAHASIPLISHSEFQFKPLISYISSCCEQKNLLTTHCVVSEMIPVTVRIVHSWLWVQSVSWIQYFHILSQWFASNWEIWMCVFVLWHVDPLQGSDHEISNYTAAVAR